MCLRLYLNLFKCIIIPLWTADLEAAADKVRRTLPQTANFRIEMAGELLCVWIGPGAEGLGWLGIQDKVTMRTGMVKQFQLGMWGSVRERSTHVFSCFSHINTFSLPLSIPWSSRGNFTSVSWALPVMLLRLRCSADSRMGSTSHQLCNYICSNCIPTLYQLRTNFAPKAGT